MGSNNSKKVQLTREQKRWLECQNPAQIEALIAAARKGQNLNGFSPASPPSILGAAPSSNKRNLNLINQKQQHNYLQNNTNKAANPNPYVIDRVIRAGNELEVYYSDEDYYGVTSSERASSRAAANAAGAAAATAGASIDSELDVCCDAYCADEDCFNFKEDYYNNKDYFRKPYRQHYSSTSTHTNNNNNNNYPYTPSQQLHHYQQQQSQQNFNHVSNRRFRNNHFNELSPPTTKELRKNITNKQHQQSLMSVVGNRLMQIQNNNIIDQYSHQTKNQYTNRTSTIAMDSEFQRGLNFTREQRNQLGLLGVLPPAHHDKDTQIKWVLNYLDKNCGKDPLCKYIFLRNLKDYNETLFYATLMTNVELLMPIVYTPVVGLACQSYSSIFMKPRGLFISLQEAGKIDEILANWTQKDVRVIVVTDGERILGLGDLGANGMGISVGKLSLYTALAGVPPKNVLPITLDVGTNNEINLADPFYIGLRSRRVRGQEYINFVDEFMKACVDRWGRSCLIQFEDFGNQNAFELLQRYRASYCTFNDDIQGTASVCLAGLLSAAKMINKRLRDMRFLFFGSGEANLGTANLLLMAMIEQGVDAADAKSRIWLVDSKGLVVVSRNDLTEHKRTYAREGPKLEKLVDIINHVKPSAIIGASAQGGAFNEQVCKLMATFSDRPIIFALSNPTSKAECTAQQAYEWTQGKCVFASGSPFEPVEFNGRRYVTGQGNNAYIFPAVGLAAIAGHMHTIPEEAFLVAASALSEMLTPSEIAIGLVYPSLTRIRECTLAIAARLLEYFYCERLATYRPEPTDKVNFLKSIQYDANYPQIPGTTTATGTNIQTSTSLHRNIIAQQQGTPNNEHARI